MSSHNDVDFVYYKDESFPTLACMEENSKYRCFEIWGVSKSDFYKYLSIKDSLERNGEFVSMISNDNDTILVRTASLSGSWKSDYTYKIMNNKFYLIRSKKW